MLDCRGLACPQPVMRTKELLDEQSPQSIEVLVDNKAASANVSRFLEAKGYATSVAAQGGDLLVKAERDPGKAPQEADPPESFTCGVETGGQLVYVRSDAIGQGDDSLGRGLMKNFIGTLKEMGPALWRIIFVNAGVKLCCEGSESLEALQELEGSGVSILVCGTCLNHFGLLEAKRVGETTNMLDVVTSLQAAAKVITA